MSDRSEARTRKELIDPKLKDAGWFDQDYTCAEAALLRLESAIQELKNTKTAVDQLKASILAEAFSGRLVAQKPSEGTGHELLKQIRAQQAAAVSSASPSQTKPKQKRGAKS